MIHVSPLSIYSAAGFLFVIDDKIKNILHSNMEEFYTKDRANEGVEMPLFKPTGEKTEHSFRILGVDSDAYAKAETAMRRALGGIQAEAKLLGSDEDRLAFVDEKQTYWKNKVLASVIADWTFDQECTEANKIEFLKNAPQIAKAVDTFISDRRLFFSLGQNS